MESNETGNNDDALEISDVFEFVPFVKNLGIEVTEMGEGFARGRMELTEFHSSNAGQLIAHGGAIFSLADTIGGAAVVSLHEAPTPTIDMRIDYLQPAQEDLWAEAEVLRYGQNVAVASVTVKTSDDELIATVHGAYKTGEKKEDSPWLKNFLAELENDS